MTIKRTLDPQFDLFVPFVADLPLRDQRETMERPFFSLAQAQAPATHPLCEPGWRHLCGRLPQP